MTDENSRSSIKGIDANFEVENIETGDIWNSKQYVLYTGCKIYTIVRVKKIYSHHFPDNTKQIDIECDALSSVGTVFKTKIILFPKTKKRVTQILDNVLENSLYMAVGKYDVYHKDDLGIVMSIYDAVISPLPKKFNIADVQKAFEING